MIKLCFLAIKINGSLALFLARTSLSQTSYLAFVKSNELFGKVQRWGSCRHFFLARLRSSSLLDVYCQGFRPVGDFTFSLPAEKVSKETGPDRFLI